MQTVFFSINPNHQNLILGNLVQFWLVTFIAVFAGYALYKLLSSPRARKNKFKDWKTVPKKLALIIAGCIGLFIIGISYIDNWSYFFKIDAQKTNLHLHYYFPERTVIISTENIKELVPKEEWRKTNNYRLIIKTKEGKEYSSSLIGSELMQKNLNRLKLIAK